MVTKLADKRGQIAIKGHEVTDEWEARVRKAAQRTGSTMAGFIVDHTTSAAQAILKNEPAIPAALPVRIEDVAAGLHDQLAAAERSGKNSSRLSADRLSADHGCQCRSAAPGAGKARTAGKVAQVMPRTRDRRAALRGSQAGCGSPPLLLRTGKCLFQPR